MGRIQNPTHGLRIRTALGLREKSAIPIVSDELVPVIVVDDVSEDVGGNPDEPTYAFHVPIGAVAAQFSYVHVRNPAGSGVIAILQDFMPDASAATYFQLGMLDPVTLASIADFAFLLNRRGIPSGVSGRAALSLFGAANGAAFVALGGALYHEIRLEANRALLVHLPGPMVIEPGQGILMGLSTVNLTFNVTAWVKEIKIAK